MARESASIDNKHVMSGEGAIVATLAHNPTRLRRVPPPAPDVDARPQPSASEERLLRLRGEIAVVPIPPHLAPAPLDTLSGSRLVVEGNRAYLPALFWFGVTTLVVVVSLASYLTARGGGTATSVVNATTQYREQSEGSGRLAIPAGRDATSVRVGVDSAATGADAWFWCIESDQPQTWAEHQCKSTGVREPDGYISAEAGIDAHVAGAGDAKYYVQMYCQSDCRWRVEVGDPPSSLPR